MLGVLIGWFGLDLLPHSLISRPLDHLINKAVSTSPLLRLYLHSFLPNKRVKYCALLSGKLPGNLFHSLSIVTTVGTSICVFLPLSTNPSLRGHVVNVGEPIDSVYYWTFATLSKLITERCAPPGLLQPKSLTLYVHEWTKCHGKVMKGKHLDVYA